MLFRTKTAMVTPDEALPGRTDQTMPVPDAHFVNGHPLQGPWPDGFETAVFGLGCFWGAEKLFWETPGVWSTAVGYAGGYTPNPTYEEVCSGRTGHAEVVLVVFDPSVVTLRAAAEGVLGGPRPDARACARATTSARSTAACCTPRATSRRPPPSARRSPSAASLQDAGYGDITTEIAPLGDFFYAEPYHQQYLAKNPAGYCPHPRHRREVRLTAVTTPRARPAGEQ